MSASSQGHGGARARSDMTGTSRTGRRWTSVNFREIDRLSGSLRLHAADVCTRVFDRSRKVYGLSPRRISEARTTGGPLAGLYDLMLAATPEGRTQIVAAVLAADDAIAAHRDPPACVPALLHAAQHSNADDVRATSDAFAALTDDNPDTDAPALRALVAAKLADIARDRRAIAAAHARLAGMEGT